MRDSKVQFVSITPLKDDTAELLDVQWLAPRPNTDLALMMGIAHTLVREGLHDAAYLDKYCVGYDVFEAYLLGKVDGIKFN